MPNGGAVGFDGIFPDAALGFGFDTRIVSSGFVHEPGAPTISVVHGGVYSVWFSVSATSANRFGVARNGRAVPAATYGSGGGTAQTTGMTILLLEGGDTISLVNAGTTATLESQRGTIFGEFLVLTNNTVSASMLIQKIG